ncbi:MAG: hypothetical protein KJO75_20525, partial [Dactylosporangium sp.]|nr:hypothetical protein [Dactylosporangium sp.]
MSAPGTAFPDGDLLRAAVVARDWSAVGGLFARLDVPNRIRLARAVVGEDDAGGGLPVEAGEDQPSLSPVTESVRRAERLVNVGWAVRTAARAKQVGREQFALLHAFLGRAERLLIDATAREPGNVEAWRLRQATAMGLG